MGDLDLQDGFRNEPYHAHLKTFSMITPIATLDNGSMLVFAHSIVGEEVEVKSEMLEVPASAMESYRGDNAVKIASLSPNGIENYQRNVVEAAITALPNEVLVQIVAEEFPDMDGNDAQRILDGHQVTSDQANTLLMYSTLIERFDEFVSEASVAKDGGAVDLADSEHAAVHDNLTAIQAQLNIAMDLPAYAHDLNESLETMMTQEGDDYPLGQVDNAIRTLAGEEPVVREAAFTLD
ncbi:MAG: hypothetical protein ACRBCT_07220 [Alphaproteobacteria bacterium]